MFRPTAIRTAAQLGRSTTRQTPRALKPRQVPNTVSIRARTYADAAPGSAPSQPSNHGGGSSHTVIILAAIAALAGGGYYLLKPVSDAAYAAKGVVNSASNAGGQAADHLETLAKSVLPPGAWFLYQKLSQSEGGLNGLLSNLKDKDMQGVLDEIKKVGGDDVKRVVEKVEAKLKEAKGDVQKVDWKSLAQELKGELPASGQKAVDILIGQIPSKEDYDQFVNKIKTEGEKKKKEIEASASKILQKVEQAKKEGKGTADAYLKGLKDAAPADVDDLIKQIKSAAKDAGLPADQIESWLKTKADDGKVDIESLMKQLEGKLRTATKFLPVEPKEVVSTVKQFSPSLAELLASTLKQADVVNDKLEVKK